MKEDGYFKKGNTPWNKNKRMNLNLKKIEKEHIKGKSILDISKELGVSDRLISLRLKENNMFVRDKKIPSKDTKDKIRNTMKEKGIQPREIYSGKPTKGCFKKGNLSWNKDKVGLQISNKKGKKFGELYDEIKTKRIKRMIKDSRKKQIFPLKDTSIEIKIQNFLKQLNINFLTHQYIKEIEHGYQCDILIPSMNLVIETDGDYWHKYPIGNDIDHIRTKELLEKGFKVLRLWEFEIKKMELNDFQSKLLL